MLKYILICLVALVVCFGLGYLISLIFRKKFNKKVHLKMFLLTVLFGIVLLCITSFIYLSIYSHAGENALVAMNGNDKVTVKQIDGGYLFDGPSENKAIVFYQGAKVDEKAYAPLMLKLSESGYDCFLADLPFNFALFGLNTADKFIHNYDYDEWIMSGHSMGGSIAANYANEHKDTIDGIILLASYPTSKVDDSIRLLSIYGSEDGCLQMEELEKDRSNYPVEYKEAIIEGGNHSGFADYGEQKGDNKATISSDAQQNKVVSFVNEFFGEGIINDKIKLYSDNNCDIYFDCFIPSNSNEQIVQLIVNNKTKDTLTIQCKELTLDGKVYTNVAVSENVYAESEGTIELRIQDCFNGNPSTFGANIVYIKNYYIFDGTEKEKTDVLIKEMPIILNEAA